MLLLLLLLRFIALCVECAFVGLMACVLCDERDSARSRWACPVCHACAFLLQLACVRDNHPPLRRFFSTHGGCAGETRCRRACDVCWR